MTVDQFEDNWQRESALQPGMILEVISLEGLNITGR